VILKCLSKKPELRYQSMTELVLEIDKLREDRVPDAVAEMMARSGGFNVPEDFFKMGGRMPAPVPASPRPGERPKWPLVAGAAGVVAAVGLVVAIFAQSSVSPASPSAEGHAAVLPAPPSSPEPAPVEPSAEPAAPAEVSVAIAIEPLDSEIFRDGKSLGTSPVIVSVRPGSPFHLEARRKGYASHFFTLDGSETKLMLRLEREKAAPAAAPRSSRPPAAKPTPSEAAAKPKPKGGLGGGEIVNPWAR
jgi:serine/threonine-protein kinase